MKLTRPGVCRKTATEERSLEDGKDIKINASSLWKNGKCKKVNSGRSVMKNGECKKVNSGRITSKNGECKKINSGAECRRLSTSLSTLVR